MTTEPQQFPQPEASDWIDASHWDEADRIAFLGDPFQRIDVRAVRFHAEQNATVRCVIRGREVKLIGEPVAALRSYLKSRDEEEVWL